MISRDVTFIDEEEVLASSSVDANIVMDSYNNDPDAEIIVPRKFNTETTTSDDQNGELVEEDPFANEDDLFGEFGNDNYA